MRFCFIILIALLANCGVSKKTNRGTVSIDNSDAESIETNMDRTSDGLKIQVNKAASQVFVCFDAYVEKCHLGLGEFYIAEQQGDSWMVRGDFSQIVKARVVAVDANDGLSGYQDHDF